MSQITYSQLTSIAEQTGKNIDLIVAEVEQNGLTVTGKPVAETSVMALVNAQLQPEPETNGTDEFMPLDERFTRDTDRQIVFDFLMNVKGNKRQTLYPYATSLERPSAIDGTMINIPPSVFNELNRFNTQATKATARWFMFANEVLTLAVDFGYTRKQLTSKNSIKEASRIRLVLAMVHAFYSESLNVASEDNKKQRTVKTDEPKTEVKTVAVIAPVAPVAPVAEVKTITNVKDNDKVNASLPKLTELVKFMDTYANILTDYPHVTSVLTSNRNHHNNVVSGNETPRQTEAEREAERLQRGQDARKWALSPDGQQFAQNVIACLSGNDYNGLVELLVKRPLVALGIHTVYTTDSKNQPTVAKKYRDQNDLSDNVNPLYKGYAFNQTHIDMISNATKQANAIRKSNK